MKDGLAKGYSSPYGKIHNKKITLSPKTGYTELLMDSFSTGHATLGKMSNPSVKVLKKEKTYKK